MKLTMVILLALFPFLHEQRYTVTYHSCENNRIVVQEGDTPFEITLFNLNMNGDEGWQKTCDLIKDAKHIEIEVDASTQISEPLAVYLFLDDELLQKTLVRSELAYTPIHNPEYKYEEELLRIENSKTTMAITQNEDTQSGSASQGWLFLLFIFLSWIVTVTYGISKLKKITFFDHFTKS